jgi:lipopolysaccharide export LptBFGC system permease protein LptF
MKRLSWLIQFYITRAVTPYLLLSWLLVSVILFVQQAGRFSDIFFGANLPGSIVWQLTAALIPNVISFTCPAAVLVGVVIGLSRMRADNELVAIRSAGMGNVQLAISVGIISTILCALAFFINLKGVPFAAQLVRRVAVQNALLKLESPVDPGSFNSEIPGYTIYVREGNQAAGAWRNIFIFSDDARTGRSRVITSREGRIDFSGDDSELVLDDAAVTTFSGPRGEEKLTTEHVKNLRVVIQTKRGELLAKLSRTAVSPEELGMWELWNSADQGSEKQRLDSQLVLQRRVLLSVTPLLFGLLGVGLVLRFGRGGRGFGSAISLTSLIIFYLIALTSEQAARTGKITPLAAFAIPVLLTITVIIWLFFSSRRLQAGGQNREGMRWLKFRNVFRQRRQAVLFRPNRALLDIDVAAEVFKYFILSFLFLASIFLIFTAFDIWKFASQLSNGSSLLGRYMLFLLPVVYIQLAPYAVAVGVLIAYSIKSRRNEVVTWTAAGRSVYRIMFPCLVLTMAIGIGNWVFQELFLAQASRTQDELRMRIRNGDGGASKPDNHWFAADSRIYSFETGNGQDAGSAEEIRNLRVYQLSDAGFEIESLITAPSATRRPSRISLGPGAREMVWKTVLTVEKSRAPAEIFEKADILAPVNEKPEHLTTSQLSSQLETPASQATQLNRELALEKRPATIFIPFVFSLFVSPFALSLSRKGKSAGAAYAVGTLLLYIAISATFEQLAAGGSVSAEVAVWGPLAMFALAGSFGLARVRS